MIHPTAIVHPKAQVDPTVKIGPYAVIDEGVTVGPQCELGPHVYMTGLTTIGSRNRFHAGCVIGDAPQDLKYQGAPTGLRIGDDNVFREHVTVHRSNKVEDETVVGNGNLLMAHSHVGHNARMGNQVILANGVLLAGHVSVGDRAFLSGNCLVHQFVRVGTLVMMQGGSAASVDVPPFTLVSGGVNILCGLNTVGLRRAGYTAEQRLELKKLYRALFRSGQNLRVALAQAEQSFHSPPARIMIEFLQTLKRGVCSDIGVSNRAAEE